MATTQDIDMGESIHRCVLVAHSASYSAPHVRLNIFKCLPHFAHLGAQGADMALQVTHSLGQKIESEMLGTALPCNRWFCLLCSFWLLMLHVSLLCSFWHLMKNEGNLVVCPI